MRAAYVVMSGAEALFLLAAAMLTPVYLTPGFYYWTGVCGVLLLMQSAALSIRLSSWDGTS